MQDGFRNYQQCACSIIQKAIAQYKDESVKFRNNARILAGQYLWRDIAKKSLLELQKFKRNQYSSRQ